MKTTGITLVTIILGMQAIGATSVGTHSASQATIVSDIDSRGIPRTARPPLEPLRIAGNTACNPRVKVCED